MVRRLVFALAIAFIALTAIAIVGMQWNDGDSGNAENKLSGFTSVQVNLASSSAPYTGPRGEFVPYQNGVIGKGKPVVLFFSASWCPNCRTLKAKLKKWYAQDAYPVSVYEVDYDTASALKQKYGVTYQHTLILIDSKGEVQQTIIGPSDTKVLEMMTFMDQ